MKGEPETELDSGVFISSVRENFLFLAALLQLSIRFSMNSRFFNLLVNEY